MSVKWSTVREADTLYALERDEKGRRIAIKVQVKSINHALGVAYVSWNGEHRRTYRAVLEGLRRSLPDDARLVAAPQAKAPKPKRADGEPTPKQGELLTFVYERGRQQPAGVSTEQVHAAGFTPRTLNATVNGGWLIHHPKTQNHAGRLELTPVGLQALARMSQ